MKDQEINIAIAVACGWCGPTPPYHLIDAAMAQPEDYCNDLNAMHEAEETLSQEQAFKFVEFLEMVVKHKSNPWSWIWLTSHASARQRADAFLRTKGLWREAIVEGGK